MSAKQHLVSLSSKQRAQVERLARSHRHSRRERTRARVLLAADVAGGSSASDAAISQAVRCARMTVARVRQRFAADGLEAALFHKEPPRRKARRLDGVAEAHLVALVCAPPPAGRKRWSLQLLRGELMAAGLVVGTRLSAETVRQTLPKKKRAQALAEADVVRSAQAERGVRRLHGGRAGGLPAPA